MVPYTYHMTQQVLSYFQVGIAVLLGTAILLQQKGQGLSGAFGGEGGFYRTKRGFEKILLISTIILSVAFIATGVVRIMVVSDSDAPADILPVSTQEVPSLPETNLLNGEEQKIPIAIPKIEVKTEPVSPTQNSSN